MNIKAFQLKNFMAFEDTDWIGLSPILLLFGRNSSGKSAVIRSLRLLKQSLNYALPGSPFAYAVEDGVDVGGFLTMANQKAERDVSDGDDIIGFGFIASMPKKLLHFWAEQLEQPQDDSLDYGIQLGFTWKKDIDSNKGGHVILYEVKLGLPDNKSKLQVHIHIHRNDDDLADGNENSWIFEPVFRKNYYTDDQLANFVPNIQVGLYHGFMPRLGLIRNKQIQNLESPEKQLLDMPDELQAIDHLLEFFEIEITNFLENIEYVRPIRPDPQRYYVLDSSQQRHWRQQGLNSFLKFLKLREKEAAENDKDDDLIYKEIERYLLALKLGTAIDNKPIAPTDTDVIFTSIQISEGQSGASEINLVDVGFGTSQVIPVLVQSILASKNSLVVIEQPELHLHPWAQAELANLFVEMANRGKHLLIETHSDNILYRIRLHIAETNLRHLRQSQNIADSDEYVTTTDFDAKNLSIYFVDRPNLTSQLVEVEIDKTGDYKNPPSGFKTFFSDDARAIMRITSAIIEASNLEENES